MTAEVHVFSSFGESRFGKFVFAMLFVVAAALASFVLAALGEALSLEQGCFDCTPGMVIANRLVPPDQAHAIHAAARGLQIGVEVDTPIWFAVICATRIIIALARRRHEKVQAKSQELKVRT
jgi:hypothetical protein